MRVDGAGIAPLKGSVLSSSMGFAQPYTDCKIRISVLSTDLGLRKLTIIQLILFSYFQYSVLQQFLLSLLYICWCIQKIEEVASFLAECFMIFQLKIGKDAYFILCFLVRKSLLQEFTFYFEMTSIMRLTTLSFQLIFYL